MSPFQTNRWLAVWVLALLDALSMLGGGLIAAWIRFLPEFLGQELSILGGHPGFIAYAVGAQWALATTFDLYRPQVWRGRDDLGRETASGVYIYRLQTELGSQSNRMTLLR